MKVVSREGNWGEGGGACGKKESDFSFYYFVHFVFYHVSILLIQRQISKYKWTSKEGKQKYFFPSKTAQNTLGDN